LAREFGVSTKTIGHWRDNYADWPARTAAGNFSRAKVDAFCRRHKLGPHRERSDKAGDMERARIGLLIEKSERLQLTNARLRKQLELDVANVVLADDVRHLTEQMAEVVTLAVDRFVESIEAELAAGPAADWHDRVRKVTAATRASIAAVVQSMQQEWKS
jgi:hypothetical protein